jgi:preprotein translocase subunit SecE
MNKISAYFRDSYRELVEKVSWPTWQQLQQTTMIVIGATLMITFIVILMDTVINHSKFGILTFVYKMLS